MKSWKIIKHIIGKEDKQIIKTISHGTYSDEIKMARVIPIIKGEDEKHVQNYRPISVF